jgi:hypothetical protein
MKLLFEDEITMNKFSIKLPRKRKFLTVQGDFDKIIDVGRRKAYFLTV